MKKTTLEQQAKRNKCIELHKNGMKNSAIAINLEVSHQTILRWLDQYKNEGDLTIKKRGRKKDVNIAINNQQEDQIFNKIINKAPKDLQFPGSELWTRKDVKKLILNVSETSKNNYIKRWKFNAVFPKMYNNKHTQLEEDAYEKIDYKCDEAKSEIYWVEKKSYLLEYNKRKVNMIYAVTNKNTFKFMLHEQDFSDTILINFLDSLTRSSENKICLVLNNFFIYREVVKDWEKEHTNKIQLTHFTTIDFNDIT